MHLLLAQQIDASSVIIRSDCSMVVETMESGVFSETASNDL
jgi:hypothetical protein